MQRNILLLGELIELAACMRQEKGCNGLMHFGCEHGPDVRCQNACGRTQRRSKVRLQRRHGHPAVLASVDPIARMRAADRSLRLRQPPAARQRQLGRGV